MSLNNRWHIAPIIIALFSAGCAVAPAERAEERVQENYQEVRQSYEQSSSFSGRTLEMNDGVWFSGQPYKLDERDRLPALFSESAPFRQMDPISLQEIASAVTRAYRIRIELSDDAIDHLEGAGESSGQQAGAAQPSTDATAFAPPGGPAPGQAGAPEIPVLLTERGLPGAETLLSVNHEGTLAGLLDTITSKAGLYWRWDHDHVLVFRHETRSYTVDVLPGNSSFRADLSSAFQPSEDGGSTSASLSRHTSSFSSEPEDPYTSVQAAVDAMLSSSGSFSLAEKTGLLTVTDTPGVHKKIAAFIGQTNEIVTQRIAVRTEVYDIEIAENGSAGIDWSAVYNEIGSAASVAASGGTNFGTTATNAILGLTVTNPGSPWIGSSAFIDLLSEYTDVSLVTTSTVYTTNGESVPVQVVDNQAYLRSVTSSTTEDGEREFELEPGVASSGITLNVLPRRLSSGDVMMQVAMDLSQLNEIREFSAGETAIQLPDQSTKSFLQRVILDSGEPLMISGFERTRDDSSTASLGGSSFWPFGGNRSGGQRKVMTMIVLTPYVISE